MKLLYEGHCPACGVMRYSSHLDDCNMLEKPEESTSASESLKFQTRSEVTGLAYWATFSGAWAKAKEDLSVWKISFQVTPNERVTIVRTAQGWVYREPL